VIIQLTMMMQGCVKRFIRYMNLYILLVAIFLLAINVQADSSVDTTLVKELIAKSSSLQRSNVDSCRILAQKALNISEDVHYAQGISAACNQLAAVMMIRGNDDSALYYCNQSLLFSIPNQDYKYTVQTHLLRNYIYLDKGKSDSSLIAIQQALHYCLLAKDSSSLGRVYASLGSFYEESKDYGKSMSYYRKAYSLNLKINKLSAACDALCGIGNILYLTGKSRTALSYYLQVDSLSRKINEPTGVAQNQNNIGLCYAELNEQKKALYYYGQALNGYLKYGMRFEEANLYYNMGELYERFKQPDSAIYYGKMGLYLARKLCDLPRVANCLQLLAKVYSQKQNYTQAYRYQRDFTLLNDSLMNIEKVRSISEMETKYETEIKTQEIDLLHQQKELSQIKASRSLGINIGLASALLGILFVTFAFYNQSKKREKLNYALQIEKQKSDDLLLNILPEEIASELKQNGQSAARQYNNVTVLFTDFVNFTGLSEQMSPTELVAEIHKNFTAFDAIIEKHGLEKIKTIGDAYLAVCGLPNETTDHAQRTIKAAMDIQQFMERNHGKFQIRMGIHSGAVVAGIVGVKKYAYDIWGDTVNMAARMEQNSEAGKINISATTYELIKREFICEYRGKINTKGKGEVEMWFVEV
jgi:adenylate cyclase